MRRRRQIGELDERPEGARQRTTRPTRFVQDEAQDEAGETQAPPALGPDGLADALLALCARFDLEAWAAERDERGLWAFASALGTWLQTLGTAALHDGADVEAVRLLTNLFIILGAVIRPLPIRPAAAGALAAAAVEAARHTLAARYGLVAPFPGAGRAMARLVRVRGWSRLAACEQSLAEALLWLYLETLATILSDPDPAVLLSASEAWLTVLHLQALPAGFDERILRATSWYLETYAAGQQPTGRR